MKNKNLKIAAVGWGFPPKIDGGLDICVCETAKCLARQGFIIHLFLPKFNSPPGRFHGPDGFKKNIVVHPVDVRKNTKNIGALIKTVKLYNRKIIGLSKRLDFDIAHTHDWLGSGFGTWIKKNTKKPWVMTLHSLEYMRSTVRNSRSYMQKVEEESAKMCDAVVTVSNFMKNEICLKYKIKPGKIKVIYNAGSIELSGNEEAHLNKKKAKNILYIGRLSAQKGIEYLLTAAKDVLKKHPDAKFIIAGYGYLYFGLLKHAKVLGIRKNVFFEGFVKTGKIPHYYKKASIFVSPSIYEPFGITIADALNFGIPVIATRNTGAIEGMKNKKECIIIAERSSRKISDAIINLLDNEKLKLSIGLNGKDFAKKYSWDKSASKVASVYYKLLRKSP